MSMLNKIPRSLCSFRKGATIPWERDWYFSPLPNEFYAFSGRIKWRAPIYDFVSWDLRDVSILLIVDKKFNIGIGIDIGCKNLLLIICYNHNFIEV